MRLNLSLHGGKGLSSVPPLPSGWWDNNGAIAGCVGAYQGLGAATYAASLANLANPGVNNLADGNHAPTFDSASGWKFNGSSQYLDTGILVTNNHTLIVAFYGGAEFGDGWVGGVDGYVAPPDVMQFGFAPNASGLYKRYYCGGLEQVSGKLWHATTKYVVALNRSGAWIGGVADAGFVEYAAAWNGVNAAPLFLGARSDPGDPADNFWSGYLLAAALYNTPLSEADVQTITAAIQALWA